MNKKTESLLHLRELGIMVDKNITLKLTSQTLFKDLAGVTVERNCSAYRLLACWLQHASKHM
jgi:hypothetical protein